jgi:hypothetical protein
MKVILAALSLVLATSLSARADLITNGGFETGDFTGWQVTHASQSLFLVGGPADRAGVHSGGFAAEFGSPNADDTIAQTILATTPGATYVLDFWLAKTGGNTRNDFSASWNGQTLLDLLNVSAFGYTEHSYVVAAAAASSTLRFAGRNGPGWYGLDDVSVTELPPATRSVPEPSSVALLGFTAVALGALARLRSVA